MFDLGTMPHRTLAGFKQQYGPVIWLKLGSINTMVVLTAKAATELFKNHDLSFAERTITYVMQSNDYHKGSLAFAPYGTHWLVLRRICTVEMFASKRINETTCISRKCVDDMLLWIEKEVHAVPGPRAIHVARFVFLASFNMFGNLLLSRDLVNPDSEDGSKFYSAMMEVMEWCAHPNIADLFPCLKWLDPQGLRRKMDDNLGKVLTIISSFVKERLKETKNEDKERKKDFLDVLLEFEGSDKDEPAKLSDHDLNIFILEIFFAGSETTSSTIEWALTELLCNPNSMIKVKQELAKGLMSSVGALRFRRSFCCLDRFAGASFRRESICWSDDSFSFSNFPVSAEIAIANQPSTPPKIESESVSQLICHIKHLFRHKTAAIAALYAGLYSEAIRHFSKICDGRCISGKGIEGMRPRINP
ncbi:hypothetical protein F0562_016841 [Nyssa sinensis]|uniref:Cytochrome P450 n=1 Tax=Nyssa sinensis TaxID=561372 RepID=A0A5J4ZDJ0_9ASTE|nr:hypothetical protein F0562_016841 [Nyssa sinensis]